MRKISALIVASLVGATIIAPVGFASADVDNINTQKLRNAVTVNGILGHERNLQRIANQNGGTRASGTSGYEASAAYVKKQLEDAGYEVTEQPFTFPFFRELSPAALVQVSPTPTTYETAGLDYSGSGEVTGRVLPTNDVMIPASPAPSSTSGCEPADFSQASETEPQIALIQRGTCTFEIKAANAQAKGYDAVVVFNEGQPGREELLSGVTLGRPFDIPVVGLSYADGAALFSAIQAGPVTLRVTTETEADLNAVTKNVIAESKGGDPNKVVVVGAHLDSVVAGPGINDNGSGTATNLEIAIQMAKLKIKPVQKLRFAFWGAEELGLLGSEHYVNELSNEEISQIYANLNFDMLGSPNYVRFVYDGDGSDGVAGPGGSAQIETIFNDYFTAQGLATEPTAFDGRSDYGPFIAVGIPAGGLFSGAEVVKSPEQAAIFGGTAGVAFDKCYHQACDTMTNLSTKALAELGDAAAHSVMTLARTEGGLFEDNSRVAARQAVSMDQFDYRGGHLVR